MTDPFAPVKIEPLVLTEDQVYYNQIDARGNVGKYKIESGAPVKVADLGNIRDYFTRALQNAALMTPQEVEDADIGSMTHIEAAAIKLAAVAATGDLKATQELLDRVLGKAKLVSESTNLNLTIDDILSGVTVKGGESIDV